MRILPLLAAATVTLAALAGCTGAGGGSPARSAYSTARERAAAWDSDAVLLAVLSLEVEDAQNATARLEAEIRGEAADTPYAQPLLELMRAIIADGDGLPGDGYAPAWAHMFVSAKGVHAVVVDDSGAVTYDRDFVGPGSGPDGKRTPPAVRGLDGDWAIDSDDAARIARENNTAYAALFGKPDTMASMELDVGGDGPQWTASIGTLDQPTASVRIDATTGKVLSSYPGNPTGTVTRAPPSGGPPRPQPRPTPDREAGAQGGTLVAVAGQGAAGSFDIAQDGHHGMALALEAPDAVGPVTLSATVTDPQGNEHNLHVGGVGVQTTYSSSIFASPVPPGHWTFTVALEQGAVQDYRLSWCTDGRQAAGGGDNAACDVFTQGPLAWLPEPFRLR